MVVSDMDIGKRTNQLTGNAGWFKASGYVMKEVFVEKAFVERWLLK